MKRRLILYVCFFLTQLYVVAQQNDAVAITINGVPIYKSELEKAYNKGNKDKEQGEKETIDEFVQSYIDYRLNIEEAKAQELDATPNYEREYHSYKMQLSNTYLKDTVVLKSLMEKYYKRMLEDVDVNHVLIPFEKKELLPADTLALYHKAMEVRNQLINNGFVGDGFIDNSVNPSIVMDITEINGHLGWITAFMLPVVLEDAIYSLPVGEVSIPIRTYKGYHIVQVVAKRSAVGAADVEQVLFHFPDIPPFKHQIDSVGALAHRVRAGLRSQVDYQKLCDDFSGAYGSAERGCAFGIVKLDTKISPAFVNAALNLQDIGEISQPVMTDFGFHILRLVNRMGVPSLPSMAKWMEDAIKGSDRGKYYINEVCERLKKEYNYSLNKDALRKVINVAERLSPENEEFTSIVPNVNEVLFTIDGKNTHTLKEFLAFVKNETALKKEEPDQLPSVRIMENVKLNLSTDQLFDLFNLFTYSKLHSYAQSVLSDRNPEFARQMEEYENGILYFDVKNRNVWEKAQTDEKGLSSYFKKNKKKYELSKPMFKGLVLHCRDEATLTQVEKIYDKLKNKNINTVFAEIRKQINKDATNVLIEKGTWERGTNPNVDNKIFGDNKTIEKRRNFPYITVVGKMIETPQDYTDVRAKVETDYQNELETKWKASLRKKYKVEIDESVLKTIK